MTKSINGRYGWELQCVTCVKKEVDIADLGGLFSAFRSLVFFLLCDIITIAIVLGLF